MISRLLTPPPVLLILCFVTIAALSVSRLSAQEEPVTSPPPAASEEVTEPTAVPTTAPEAVEETSTIEQTANDASEFVNEKTEEIRQQVDASPEAQKYSAGILQPIYALAEYLSFASFHWIAFAIMISGVVSFTLQLVLGKLVVLARGGFSPAEILSDIQCLVISLVGLVLTTQAATENSAFTRSAAAVLSATVLGGLVGFMFYLWGQAAEVQATKGRQIKQITNRR